MKRLILLRHAKSDWDDAALADFDRPLSPRGEAATAVIGRHLADNGLLPDAALCSAAVRTRQTWSRIAGAFPAPPLVEHRRSLYEAAPQRIIEEIRTMPAEAETLCVVGHHPGIDGAALVLSGTGDRAAIDRIRVKFPTCAYALIHIGLESWAPLNAGMGELVRFVRPKDLA